MFAHSIPNITGETIDKIITEYHSEKLNESGACYRITHPVSEFMHTLENFYNFTLNNKKTRLTSKECLELAKILYVNHHKSGKKSLHIKNYLLRFFNFSVLSALFSSATLVDYLSDHFETMCQSPENAANIAYAVLKLKNHIHAIKKLNILNELYTEKLYKQLYNQPALAIDVITAYQFLLNFKENNEPIELLKKDRRVYLLSLLNQQIELTNYIVEKIKMLSIKQLDALLAEIADQTETTKSILRKYIPEGNHSEALRRMTTIF